MSISKSDFKKQKIRHLRKLVKKLGDSEHLSPWETENMLWILGYLALEKEGKVRV